jgi:hypothetical protein
MKVCVLIVCELLSGGLPRECDRAIPPTIVEVPQITTYRECVEAARRVWRGEVPLPAGLRLTRIDMMPPEPTQEAKR